MCSAQWPFTVMYPEKCLKFRPAGMPGKALISSFKASWVYSMSVARAATAKLMKNLMAIFEPIDLCQPERRGVDMTMTELST